MSEKPKLDRDYVLQVRTYTTTSDMLKELTTLQSRRLGTKLTQAQVLEMLLSKALQAEQAQV